MPESKKIDSVINDLLRKYNLNDQLDQFFIFDNWEKIVGKTLSKNCKPQKIEGRTLYLNVKNSIWRQELSQKQSELLKMITKNVKTDVIKKIKFI